MPFFRSNFISNIAVTLYFIWLQCVCYMVLHHPKNNAPSVGRRIMESYDHQRQLSKKNTTISSEKQSPLSEITKHINDITTTTTTSSSSSIVTKRTKVLNIIKNSIYNQSKIASRQRWQPNNNNNTTNNNERRILFVHIGKAGGESIKNTLRIKCEMMQREARVTDCSKRFNTQAPELEISKQTKLYLHCNNLRPKHTSLTIRQDITTFLFVLRDPIDRVISWFRYMNPANCLHNGGSSHYHDPACRMGRKTTGWAFDFFQQCFADVDDFAIALYPKNSITADNDNNNNTTLGVTCSELAWMTILGQASKAQSSHMYFNHRYYISMTTSRYPQKEVFVIRTEYLWNDLFYIEQAIISQQINKQNNNVTTSLNNNHYDTNNLTQQQQWVPPQAVTHNSEKYTRNGTLSKTGLHYLCCALMDEINVYIELLQMAKNLGSNDKSQSMINLFEHCDVLSMEELQEQCNKLDHPHQWKKTNEIII